MPHLFSPFSERNRHQNRRTLRATKKIATAASAVRAELVGTNCATALGIEATGPAPVLTLCRELLAAGVTPDQCLEVYRGAVLALRVCSIGEAAKLTVEDNHGRPTFRSWRDRPGSDGAAPAARQNRRVAG